MQIGASNNLFPQLQTLGNAAASKYQNNQDFSFLLQLAGETGSSGSGSTDAGLPSAGSESSGSYQVSGSFQQRSLVAVGTIGSDGKLVPFSDAQVKSEYAAVDKESQSAYADALQNFLTLSQAGGSIGATTLTDQQQFTADNGLISGSFNTSFSLK